jgi:gamma-glutamyltranspeptidase / glutathione hydrolase
MTLHSRRVLCLAWRFAPAIRRALILCTLLPGLAPAEPSPLAPEAASGWEAKQPAYGKRFMVAAAHPLAVEAGVAMLKRGGSAIDAAIATSLVLNLVEPESSGIGGGGFLLHYDRAGKSLVAYDGRETAPAEATAELFLDQAGKPLKFLDAVVGGRSVGVPGLVRSFEVAHARHGKLAWASLFEPAIQIAERGFPISARLAQHIAGMERLDRQPAARAYFFHPDGTPRQAGEIVTNNEFAMVLRQIARHGSDAFYEGELARDMVQTVRSHATNPGRLSEADLKRYRVRVRAAVCGSYRLYIVCGAPPPSSGAIAVLQILGLLERADVAAFAPLSTDAVHRFSEAGRLAYADRERFVADPDFVDVPIDALIGQAYLDQRSRLIRADHSIGKASAGEPVQHARAAAAGEAWELPATSHIAIVDAQGNAVSLTQSIEYGFGSHLMTHGFLLNNQLTDFSFLPMVDGLPVANRVQPGKRPRSAMAPMLVFDQQQNLLGVVGSPGGSSIINYVAKVLVGVVDWKLDLQEAVDLPNFGSRNGPTELEQDRHLEGLQAPLEALGHEVRFIELNSGIHAIWRTRDGWEGAADPRRVGVARGK